jgi:hypothetical protein
MSGYVSIPAFELAFRSGAQDAGAGPPQNTVLATSRLDWAIDQKTQLFFRYALQNQDTLAIVSQPYSRTLDQPEQIRNQNFTLNLLLRWCRRETSCPQELKNCGFCGYWKPGKNAIAGDK